MKNKRLYDAVMATREVQEKLEDLKEKIKLLIIDFEEKIEKEGIDGKKHKATLEGCQVYLGMVMSSELPISRLFLNFKMPGEIGKKIKLKKPIIDPEYVKECLYGEKDI